LTSIHTGSGPDIKSVVRLSEDGAPSAGRGLWIDRQLEEAVTVAGDPLHLGAVFGMSEATAIRYAVNARQLLDEPHAAPSGSPGTQ
jgi:hypothetical protein